MQCYSTLSIQTLHFLGLDLLNMNRLRLTLSLEVADAAPIVFASGIQACKEYPDSIITANFCRESGVFYN
jgi:hypothetical protein